MVDDEQEDIVERNSAYQFAKRIQRKYGEKFDITVIGLYSNDCALMSIKRKGREGAE